MAVSEDDIGRQFVIIVNDIGEVGLYCHQRRPNGSWGAVKATDHSFSAVVTRDGEPIRVIRIVQNITEYLPSAVVFSSASYNRSASSLQRSKTRSQIDAL